MGVMDAGTGLFGPPRPDYLKDILLAGATTEEEVQGE